MSQNFYSKEVAVGSSFPWKTGSPVQVSAGPRGFGPLTSTASRLGRHNPLASPFRPPINDGLGSESRPLPNQERTVPLRYRVSVASIQQPTEASKSPAATAEAVRVQRLRDDARRPMSINLAEGIALSHKLMQFVGTARPH
jgi:hypothetical protein